MNQSLLEVSTAFSREQAEKVYVQNRLKEQAQKIWDLIQDGALIYVCGDASKISPRSKTSI